MKSTNLASGAAPPLSAERWDDARFDLERARILATWRTGSDVDLNDAASFHRSRAALTNVPRKRAWGKESGTVLLQPYGGVTTLAGQTALIRHLAAEGGADIVPTTIDSQTRNLKYAAAEEALRSSEREGAELLHDQTAGPLVPSQRQVVSIMRDNSAKLQRLIEELLDYQRVLHAAAVLETQPVALDALLREVAHSHGLSAAAKGLQFALELPPLQLEADREKLRSVFDNLVGNAVKFTPRGGRVTLRLQDLGNDVLVEVVDTGPGVPPEERETIFDTFFRGRVRGSARVESSGLGLAIAREFTEAHRGRIDLVAGGPGGHFRVRLPKRAASLQAEAA